MKTSVDNVIFYVEKVTPFQFENFLKQLDLGELHGKIQRVKYKMGTGASEYHHNLYVGEGGGAIYIGYEHNSSPRGQNSYRLRLEVNPSKHSTEQLNAAKEWFIGIFVQSFWGNTKLIKGIDLAFDVPIALDRLHAISLTGRARQQFKNTVYFGTSGKHGRLKMYDKKAELKKKQGIEIPEEHLTRIEYSIRMGEPVTFQLFSKVGNMNIDKEYQISEFKIGETEGLIKACVLAVISGEMELKEFTRTYREKTKKALADMGLLELDRAYSNAHGALMDTIHSWLVSNKDTILA